jgi:hypothetical protein
MVSGHSSPSTSGYTLRPTLSYVCWFLRAGSNRLEALLPLMPSVLEQLVTLPPGRTEIIAASV